MNRRKGKKQQEKILTLEQIKTEFQGERDKDADLQRLERKEINCEKTFEQRFDEHVNSGEFEASIKG